MSICCPLCYKVEEGGDPAVDGFAENGEKVQQRFFKLFQRYLDNQHGGGTRAEGDGIGGEAQFFFLLEEFVEIGMVCCGDCLKLMESFCELYNQLMIIELRLNWQVLKVMEILKSSGKVKSRLECFLQFSEFVGRLELGEGRWRDSGKLTKSILKSRKSLISKCSKKMKTSYPKLGISDCKNGANLSNVLHDTPNEHENQSPNPGNRFYQLHLKCPDCSILNADVKAKKIFCSFCRKSAEIHCRKGLANLTSPPKKVARRATTDTNSSSDSTTDDPRGTSTAVENEIPTYSDDDQLSTHDDDNISDYDSFVSLNALMNEETLVSGSSLKPQLPSVKPTLERDVMQIQLENPPPRAGRMPRLRSTHRCQHCGRTFSSNKRLQLHQQEDHIDEDDQSDGDDDDESGKRKSDDIVSKNKRQCQHCGEILLSSEELTFHVAEAHKEGVDDEDDMASDNYSPPLSDDEYKGSDIESCYEEEIGASLPKSGSSKTRDSKLDPVWLNDTSYHIDQPTPSQDNDDDQSNTFRESNVKNMGMIAGRTMARRKTYGGQCKGFQLKCPDCNILYENTKSLLTHRMTSDPCKTTYDPTTSVRVEVLVPSSDGNTHQGNFTRLVATIDLPQALFVCEDCGLALYSLEDMENHKELHGSFPCKFCKLQFTYATQLAKHELQHSKQNRKGKGKKLLYCSRCDFNCENRFKIYAHHHLKTHLSLTLNQPVCAICKTNSLHIKESQLAHHFKYYHNIGRLKTAKGKVECTIGSCNAYFLTPRQRSNHLMLRHNIDTEKDIKCKDCDKTFARKSNLQEHRFIHHVRKEKLIYCPFKRCNRAFELKKELEQHMKIYSAKHRNMEKCCSLKCPYCNRLFGNMKTIILHLKDSPSCGTTYDPTASVNVLIYVTPNNERTLEKIKGDASPIATIYLPLEIYICKTCGVATYSKKDEKIHEKLHGLFHCDFCDFTSSYAPKLSIHELQHCPGKRTRGKDGNFSTYNCSRCDFEKSVGVGNKKNYVRHHLKEHLSLTYNIQPNCAICKSTSSEKYNLGEHLKIFHDISDLTNPKDIKPCTEDKCKAYFLTNYQLQSHLRRRHNKAKKSKFTCHDCGRSFAKYPDLRRHRLKSHVELDKVIPCCVDYCAQKFESREDMIRHLLAGQSHKPNAEAKDVQCPTCEAVLSGTDPKILRQHLRSQHAKEKPTHVCEHCGKIFQLKTHLERHYLSHSGPASWEFMCSVCARKCMTKQKLKEHMMTHTEEKPFVCGVCGLKYAHRHTLRIHANSKHGDEVQDVPMISGKGIKRKHDKI